MKNKTAENARRILAAFLPLLGIFPSVSDTFSIQKDGRYNVYAYQVRISAEQADALDPDVVESQLTAYLKFNSPQFSSYGAIIGVCPNGCYGMIYIGIYR